MRGDVEVRIELFRILEPALVRRLVLLLDRSELNRLISRC